MIEFLGKVCVPDKLLELAESIRHQNNKVNTPRKFTKYRGNVKAFTGNLAIELGVPESKLDWVLFSCPEGAEEHTDDLNVKKYGEKTFLIPILLEDSCILHTPECSEVIDELGCIYEINHQRPHSLEKDKPSGCVFIMASILQD